jgi:formylglycine-generating enzyme required for sulfatase activity
MAGGDKLKVFISYSRKDSSDFADELVAGLELAGFAPFLDRHDIAAGEDWEARLGRLIEEADTVVYVISPEAVRSERCIWEVDKTLALSKRLIPVIFKPTSEIDIPKTLGRLQRVRFDEGLGITRPLAQLAEALRQDLDWIREHTRIADLATRWQARGRPMSLLLRGDELVAARSWAARRRQEAPEITKTQTEFLNASVSGSRVTRRRQLLVQAAFGALGAIIIAGVAAYWNEQPLKELYNWFIHVRGYVRTAEQERALKPGESFRECDDEKYCPEMVVVPAGEFMMGSPDYEKGRYDSEGPRHPVKIARRFAISKYEVTFDQWDACVATGGCNIRGAGPSIFGRGRQPAIYVSWDDAQQYVKWLSGLTGQDYRLLSEAEWEYAARAGTTSPYSFGGDEAVLGDYVWYDKNSDIRTHPVGEKKANAFGLFDMHGNVWEWVEDCYDSYDRTPIDGSAWTKGDCSRRVARGGSWVDNPRDLRSAGRFGFATDNRNSGLGFRVGRTLSPWSIRLDR